MSLEYSHGPYKYNISLGDGVLYIHAKHIDECLSWGLIEGAAGDTNVNEEALTSSKQKHCTLNLGPEEWHSLFKNYIENGPNDGVKVTFTFPSTYKCKDEHLKIQLEINMKLGIQKDPSYLKDFILLPQEVLPEIRTLEKMERVESKLAKKVEELSLGLGKCATIDMMTTEMMVMKEHIQTVNEQRNAMRDVMLQALHDKVSEECKVMDGQTKAKILEECKGMIDQSNSVMMAKMIEECKRLITESKTS